MRIKVKKFISYFIRCLNILAKKVFIIIYKIKIILLLFFIIIKKKKKKKMSLNIFE
jgi:hypothetical protein